ncbi:hypothetical protein N7530_003757 [Penicillium desertorum]|uniref:Uncharacterized protein n=1 Tax=Penicillium desertorum TaxID=1303715 RepID=A0A9W9WWY3_9EURO|nr:hypothetical protein N7530_003757 [Penicillium desertorum]
MTTTKSLMPAGSLMCNKTADAEEALGISTDSDMYGAVRDKTQETRILLSSPVRKIEGIMMLNIPWEYEIDFLYQPQTCVVSYFFEPTSGIHLNTPSDQRL